MKPWVIKLGGAALTNMKSISELAHAVAILKKRGEQVVVVHGGGPMINQKLKEKNISWNFFEGQRITTPEMMTGINEALGEVNKTICDVFTLLGIKNIGISGHTSSMFHCQQMKPELGLVGEITHVNTHAVQDALAMDLVPVIAPIGVGEEFESFNINADWGASHLASAINAKNLVFATDQRGILDLNELPYDSLTLAQLRILMEKGGVTGGMLAKSRSIEHALLNGVNKVCVTHALEMLELIETKFGGTQVVLMSRLDYVMKMKENLYAVS